MAAPVSKTTPAPPGPPAPPVEPRGTTQSHKALLASLPDAVGGNADGQLPQLDLIPGVSVVWIRYDPVEMSKASRDGFHLPKVGDPYIINADMLQESPEGYLLYGDAIPAIVKTQSLATRSKQVIAKYFERLQEPESPHSVGERMVITQRKIGEDEPESTDASTP